MLYRSQRFVGVARRRRLRIQRPNGARNIAFNSRRYGKFFAPCGNADTIAGETAKALAGLFDVTLVFCFEKKGVLRDENDDDSVIPQITPEEFKQYVADGVIQGGMIPKLENSFEALDAGVSEVVITLASAINGNGGTRIRK